MRNEAEPLISIIIPSGGRRGPSLLKAVQSARCPALGDRVEILVIFNGPAAAEQQIEFSVAPNLLHVFHIEQANANSARQAGKHLAKGRFIRFLDDDDTIDPANAEQLYSELADGESDILSGSIRMIDDSGEVIGIWEQPATNDFACGMLSQRRMSQLTGHIFRRLAIANIPFDESLEHTQDIDWLLKVAAHPELRWTATSKIMGNWTRHTGPRISTSASLAQRKRLIARGILRLVDELTAIDALTPERCDAAASGLWRCVYSSLFTNPLLWSHVAMRANSLAPGSHPDIPAYNSGLLGKLPIRALYLEWLLAPARGCIYLARRLMLKAGLRKSW